MIPKILLEYPKLFLTFVNVNFTEPARAIFIFPFLNFFLKVYKLSMSFQLSGSMFHIFGPKNETLSLPWYTDLTSGLENLEIYLKL